MDQFKDTLITLDTTGKVRVVYLESEWNNDLQAYCIVRRSGCLGGKLVIAPTIVIDRGKVKRTIHQQNELQYNSELKKYLDKGYKNINDLGITELTVESAKEALGNTKTDQKGSLKPMLCKVLDKSNKKLTDKTWLASYKHDGLRCMLFLRDGEVHTSSRGGQDYDIAATYIREDPFVNKLLKENPDLILDGELYHHGSDWNLQRISGLGRKQELEEDHKLLNFHCYDIVDEKTPFKLRAKRLGEIKEQCPSDSRLVIVNHVPVTGLDEIMKWHDKAVSEGYEGLVIRDPEMPYKCGARDYRMLKIKEFDEAEFKITGYELGLRGVEDMCFVLSTDDGKSFKAKPMGDKATKEDYILGINEIIGMKGTVRYFHLTPEGIPNLPVFVTVRYDLN